MQNFPADIINQNGSQIYELVAFLSGKKPPGQAPKNLGSGKDANAKDTLKVLMTQYEELINFLKVTIGKRDTQHCNCFTRQISIILSHRGILTG